jgi:hypothetical protein
LAKKALFVWIFSSATFVSLLHLIDAISVTIFNNHTVLLGLYPFIGEKLQTLAPTIYLTVTAIATVIMWGITCATAFDNPMEIFLNKILSDAKEQSAVENQLLENKGEILDQMYETIEADNEILAKVKDLMSNVRADVREIKPMKDSMEKVRTELASLKKEIKRIEEKTQLPKLCTACGKPLLPDFKMCPYCGEKTTLETPPIIDLKNYK